MKIDKLRSIREGQRKVIENQLEKIENAKVNSLMSEFRAILDSVSGKFENLTALNEKILEQTEISEIEEEIMSSEDYSLQIQIKLREFREFSECSTQEQSQRNNSSLPNEQQTIFVQERNNGVSTQYSRLPKLSLPTFDGNILEWQAFWDSYSSAVDANLNLTDVQKFNYLRSQLEGDAARKIDGFALTNANYGKALELLHEQYGQKQKIVHAYIQSLVKLPLPSNTLQSLGSFYDKLETYIRGLESLDQHEDTFGTFLVPVIFDKLPAEIRRNLARVHKGKHLKLDELRRAIYDEINVIEAGQISSDFYETPATMQLLNASNSRPQIHQYRDKRQVYPRQQQQQRKSTTESKVCAFCSSCKHFANDCDVMTDYTSRIAIVRSKRLCFNCLGTHQVSNCKSKKKCRNCQKRHHTSICQNPHQSQVQAQSSSVVTSSNSQHQAATLHTYDNITFEQTTSIQHTPHVLLKTAISTIASSNVSADTNILFDEGSQRSFITKEHAEKLRLTSIGTDTLHLASFGNTKNEVRHLDTATVFMITSSGERIPINVLIVPTIAVPLQKYNNKVSHLKHLKGLKLAHPVTDDTTFEVQLLIGADHYWQIIGDEVIRGTGPTAVSSKIGYLLSGPVPFHPFSTKPKTNLTLNVISQFPNEIDLEQFWKLESIGIQQSEDEVPEKKYMTEYQDGSITFTENKYTAQLPWKLDHPTLPSNYDIVKRRTQSLINKLRQDPVTLKHYGDIIKDQENRGFIEKVPDTDQPRNYVHYIPHHAVKKDSSTTPIRIVYDCSCKTSRNHPSLNDCLMSTPPELNDLTAILARFRLKQYAVVTDIEKAFLQVGLHEDDRDVTRFLWLSDPTNPDSILTTYRFKSVLFGAVCSPFILNATLLKHLQINSNTWVSEILQKDLYVDNFLSSLDDETDVMRYFKESRDLMSDGGFTLRSWNSNSQALREKAKQLKIHDKDEITKTLGMRWEPETDYMTYPEKPIQITPSVTKRYILQSTSRIYDPIGFLTPVTVKAKILIQDLWKNKFDWDTILPKTYQQRWIQIATDLNAVMTTRFQRYYFDAADDRQNTADDTRLHIFVDASIQSYGATAYICRGNQSSLVMAKNRVSPLKPLTLPKLELMAAVIGVRLSQHLKSALGIETIDYWSDSQIVIHWLRNAEKTNRFVQRRVEEIRNKTGTGSWRYCPTQNNPADLLTRGISSSQYKDNKLWFTGPTWLIDETKWPEQCKVQDMTVLSTLQENRQPGDGQLIANNSQKSTSQTPTADCINVDVTRFSNLQKLLRVTAYVRRFIHNCKTQREDRLIDTFTISELHEAELSLIRQCQYTAYSEVFENIRSRKSRLPIVRQLRLYIDDDGYIRCGGRIHNAPLEEYTKFPYLLPPKYPLTRLIVLDAHQKQLHSGISATICHLRQRFWIPTIRQTVKTILRKCVRCRKINSKPYSAPDPPPLPDYRVESSSPFTITGVDFSGPMYVKAETGRETKAYVCLFTCASTRAVHLELVPDLTEYHFIQAFKRFISRRSLPRMMVSDNGATFHAASNTIKSMFQSRTLRDQLSNTGTEWTFIPTRAPWFGGWWERMVGLVKTSLKKVIGRALVTFEELQTTLIEVECILNDRPLTYVTSDNADPEPITPSHLLSGRRISCTTKDMTIPTTVISNQQTVTRRVRAQRELINRWWTRWQTDYLTSLRERHTQSGRNEQTIRVGDIVQVHDDNSRLLWKLAMVEEVLPGRDGLIRAARIRTGCGHTVRPITRLYPLELNEN